MAVLFVGRHQILRCMGNSGICRNSCKRDEQPYFNCRNYQSCCLQSYMRISISGSDENSDWSYKNQWPKIP
ncbi:beta-defensin 119-like [Tupaia chinensis]|uniref:beta-defensin 119-like n=1 Tax=Tupaia chinensis TaxID=246437 RepID=UPI0003C9200A|nr:beta-defensin 119-like [Tupaia chinensis]